MYGWGLGRSGPAGPGLAALTLVLIYPGAALRAERNAAARWEELIQEYPDRLEGLEVTFGRWLRAHQPAVGSAHAPGRLEFRGAGDLRLTLQLAEPVRTALGWGGARLQGWRGAEAIPLPVADLFLTLARGREPEWVGRAGRRLWRHRLAVVDDLLVAAVCRAVFGAPG